MNTKMRSVSPLRSRTAWAGWLLALLSSLFILVAPEIRAEKSKPGANSLMTTPDKAELERQMVAIQERLTNAVEALNKQQAKSSTSDNLLSYGVVALVIATFVFLRFAPRLNLFMEMRTKARMAAAGAGSEATASLLAEEQSVAAFAERFRIGPKPATSEPIVAVSNVQLSARAVASETQPQSDKRPELETKPMPEIKPAAETKPAPDPIKEFLAAAPNLVEKLRELLQRAETESEQASKLPFIKDFATELGTLRVAAEFPAALPAWQMATALEGLVKQLIEKPHNITNFTLHTVRGAVGILAKICVPDLPAELLADPPIRLLAVDDDPLSRHAVAFALKKALSQPDMAANGQAALALATQIGYDAVFVDVQMPGMDGFELCGKIHETPLNATTPVVFVTCQSDEEARKKATAVGGEDMIAKPFLIFEITVKAVSLVMQRRLESMKQPKTADEKEKAAPLVPAAA